MSPDRSTADRLNDHLDAIVTGDAKRLRDLDPANGATVARFFAADDAPAPPSGLADQIWAQLTDQTAAVERIPRIPGSLPHRNGRVPPPPRQIAPPDRGSAALGFLATAALLVLTLIGSFVAFRGSLHLTGPDQRAVIIPAIDNTPATMFPSGVTSDVILLRATLEQMPSSGGTHQIALNRIRLAPGAVQPAGNQADTGVGLDLFTVESGKVTVEADAPVFLTRAAANPAVAPSPVPTGTAIVLDVGDQLYAPSGVSFRRRNDGLTPATMLDFSIGTAGDIFKAFAFPPGVTYVYGFPFKLPSTYPAAPSEATVHRLTLAPGAELAIRDLPGLELVYVESGALDLIYAKAGSPEISEQAFTISAGSGTETFGRTPERAVLANRGAEPLVILTASLVPANAGEATPPTWSDGWGSGDRLEE